MADNKSLTAVIGADITEYRRELREMLTETTKLGKDLQKIGKDVTKQLTLPLAGFATAALASSNEAKVAFVAFGSDIKQAFGEIGTAIFRALNLQGILDAMKAAAQAFANTFGALPQGVQTAIVAVGTFAASLFPLIFAIGSFQKASERMKQGLHLLGTAATFLALNPIGLMITALIAGAAAFALFGLRAQTTVERVDEIANSTQEAGEQIQRFEQILKNIKTGATQKELDDVEKKIAQLQEGLEGLSSPFAGEGAGFAAGAMVAQLNKLTAKADELRGILQETTKARINDEIASRKQTIAFEEEATKIKQVNAEYAISNDRIQFLESSINVISNTKKKLLELYGPENELLRNYILSIKILQEELDALRAKREQQNQISDSIRKANESIDQAILKFGLMGNEVDLLNTELQAQQTIYLAMAQGGKATADELARQKDLVQVISAELEDARGAEKLRDAVKTANEALRDTKIQSELFGQTVETTNQELDRQVQLYVAMSREGKSTTEEMKKQKDLILSMAADAERLKKQTALTEDIDHANDALRRTRSEYELLGGGISTVRAEQRAALEIFHLMEESGVSTNEELARQADVIRSLHTPWTEFIAIMQEVPTLAQQIGAFLADMVNTFAQSVGNAVAQVLVYGASLAETIKVLLRQIAAQIISTLIRIAIERLVAVGVAILANALELTSTAATQAAAIYLAAFAATAAIPIVGPALAPGVAQAAVATALSGAASAKASGAAFGAAGFATGGIAVSPTAAIFAEEEPEIALTRKNVREFLGFDRDQGNIENHIYLDGREIARTVTKRIPKVLRLHGITV